MSPVERLRAEDRKQSIVEAAMPLFARKGLKATTTREIAEAAGASEALIYKHFPSKESIYREMFEWLCGQNVVEVGQIITRMEPGTRTFIFGIYYLMVQTLPGRGPGEEQRRTVRRIIMHSLLEDGEFARQLVEARLVPFLPWFDRMLDASVAAGDFVDHPRLKRARVLLCHHLAAGVCFKLMPDKKSFDYQAGAEELVRESILFALRGIGLKEEAIQKHYRPEEFDRLIQQMEKEVNA